MIRRYTYVISLCLIMALLVGSMDQADETGAFQASVPTPIIEAEEITVFRQVAITAPLPAEPAVISLELKEEIICEPLPEPSSEPIQINEEDKELIARVVWGESRGECTEGMVAVAQVVINRWLSGAFGSTIRRVVFAKYQFAVGRKYNDECMAAVETAIAEMSYPPDMYYFQKSKRKHWRDFIYYCRIGNHSFYLAGRE